MLILHFSFFIMQQENILLEWTTPRTVLKLFLWVAIDLSLIPVGSIVISVPIPVFYVKNLDSIGSVVLKCWKKERKERPSSFAGNVGHVSGLGLESEPGRRGASIPITPGKALRVCTAKCLLKDVIDFQVVRQALSCPAAARPGSISALNWNLSDVCRCEALCSPPARHSMRPPTPNAPRPRSQQ